MTEDEEQLREIVDVYLLPADDIYVVKQSEKEILLPAIEDLIKRLIPTRVT